MTVLGNMSKIVKITPTCKVLQTFSQTFPPVKMTTFRVIVYLHGPGNSECMQSSVLGKDYILPLECSQYWPRSRALHAYLLIHIL